MRHAKSATPASQCLPCKGKLPCRDNTAGGSAICTQTTSQQLMQGDSTKARTVGIVDGFHQVAQGLQCIAQLLAGGGGIVEDGHRFLQGAKFEGGRNNNSSPSSDTAGSCGVSSDAPRRSLAHAAARASCSYNHHSAPAASPHHSATALAAPGKKTARLHELRLCGLALQCVQQRLHPPLLLLELGGPGVSGPPRLGCRRPQGVRVGMGCKGEEGEEGAQARERWRGG